MGEGAAEYRSDAARASPPPGRVAEWQGASSLSVTGWHAHASPLTTRATVKGVAGSTPAPTTTNDDEPTPTDR